MKNITDKKQPSINKSYVSEIDRFLISFDKTHPEKSFSQQQEIKIYRELMAKRDMRCSDGNK